MSDSGEMSEFGYIMDLLARGKVSGGARGAEPPGRSPGAPRSFPGWGWEPASRSSARRPRRCRRQRSCLLFISEMCQRGVPGVCGARGAAGEAPRDLEERALSPRRWGSGLGVELGAGKGRALAKGALLEAPRAAQAPSAEGGSAQGTGREGGGGWSLKSHPVAGQQGRTLDRPAQALPAFLQVLSGSRAGISRAPFLWVGGWGRVMSWSSAWHLSRAVSKGRERSRRRLAATPSAGRVAPRPGRQPFGEPGPPRCPREGAQRGS